jgi:hypothetical protein
LFDGAHKNVLSILVGKLVVKIPLGRPSHGWIILKWILKTKGIRMWTRLIWLRIQLGGGFL